ncbi:MAG: MBL fold metallo-hydrolase [Caldilineaceae bacterium]
MLLRYFYDERLAHASYMVGCQRTGEALVVDPGRDIDQYLEMATKEGLRVTHVADTHIHADYVSGARELGAKTGATLYLSDEGDAFWKYGFADQPNVILVKDGDTFKVGNIKMQVIHTPGHTPEHVAYMLTDAANADRPMGVFTGDFLFVGDIGRPDLLEEAAGLKGTKEPGARKQFHTVQRFKDLPDYLQIWPAHGAGSACGKALGAIPSSTLGYEKLFNPAFQFQEEDAFVKWLLDGQPEPPWYFAQMKKVNKVGPELLDNLEEPTPLSRQEIDTLLAKGAMVVDLRSRQEYAKAHIPNTLNVPLRTDFNTFVGWFVNYEQPLYLIAPAQEYLPEVMRALRKIGVDNLPGVALADVVKQGSHASLPEISAVDLAKRLPQNGLQLLDVRNFTEYKELHIEGAKHIPLGHLPRRIQEIATDRPIFVNCQSGYRSQVATTWLRAHGFSNVINLRDPQEVWVKELPTTVG